MDTSRLLGADIRDTRDLAERHAEEHRESLCLTPGKMIRNVAMHPEPKTTDASVVSVLETDSICGSATIIGLGGAPARATTFPADPQERKKHPVGSGVLDYFPDALVAVARVSWMGNEQHNPGQPLHWARGKSGDHWDALLRHGLERGIIDGDGMRHSAKMAWRALALLQEEIEAERNR